ncbi:sensor domain-containing diguanylate cyclase [Alloalcanivorax marinus]|uniref:GGDEF domain-containing protein n=1 Tax=Alloalcanivorax marinus TaxID=1177169 RepID=UPI00195EB7DC|nr:GGDEF domain-containing protein [Alloalcanivorax marinus]MBM7332902.1 GGDEF domain-containing protein [Alloalcanivorax marinus]
MPNEIVVAGLTGAGVDTWALWIKIMAVGATATLSTLMLVFTVALYRHRDHEASVALHFSVANLCATAYVAGDIGVRVCLLDNDLRHVMIPYRLSLSAVVMSLASLFALHRVLASRVVSTRRLAAIYGTGAVISGLFWVDHPALIIASERYRITNVGVFADYGALAAPFYVACLAALVMVSVGMLRQAFRARGRLLWRMTMFGFAVFFLAGLHDMFRELGLELLPFSGLTMGCAVFQIGAFATMVLHYSHTLRERAHHDHQLRRLEDRVVRDALSGLFNRAYLEQRLDHLPPAAGGGLLFIDLDHFKGVNDRFGHDHGDRLIRAVADAIRRTVREQDIACRWGGDEFVVYLADADEAAARVVVERLLRAFRHLQLDSTPNLDVGASVGFAALRDEDWRATLQRADQALYQAKAEGRNRLAVG